VPGSRVSTFFTRSKFQSPTFNNSFFDSDSVLFRQKCKRVSKLHSLVCRVVSLIYMLNAILGTKIRQTQQFSDSGKRIPVTVLSVGPCWITGIYDTDNRPSVQLGFGTQKHTSKPLEGHIKKAGIQEKPRFLRTIQVPEIGDLKPGQEVHADEVFKPGDDVKVIGVSKGKGFAGVMKRHGFHGGPATHGQSDRARAPGSIGQTTTPGRVYRGKRMAGRMGGERVTVGGLSVVSIDRALQTMTVKGLVPGGKNAFLIIQKER
jgi:large subunit ribosomal protein L3